MKVKQGFIVCFNDSGPRHEECKRWLLDNLPLKSGKKLMSKMIETYHRTYAYEYCNGSSPMVPAIQLQIVQRCRELGWESEVEFDRYAEEYEW